MPVRYTLLGTLKIAGMSSSDVYETVCAVDDLNDDEMKEFTLDGGGRILIVKVDGQFSALGAKCTHYGAPLAKGVLCNGMVRCPWHSACFSVKTGDIEDFPGLDSLPTFDVKVDGDKVKVRANRKDLETSKREVPTVSRDPKNTTTCVVIGAGAAASVCVETLRQEGFTGRIVMVTKEKHIPYDRPMLSKALDSEVSKISLRTPEYYEKHDIEVMSEKEVSGLNTKDKKVLFDDGTDLGYHKLLIATGGIPRRLTTPGSDLKNVEVLRSADDANRIMKLVKDKDVVILGLSFIGMEAAAFLVGKAKSVTVIGTPSLPFLPVLGEKIATRLKKLFEEKGVVFSEGGTIKEFVGAGGSVKEVLLGNGDKIPADMCLLGIGVSPATGFLKDSDVTLTPEGFVIVDKTMHTNLEGVYAAGDIVKFPLFVNRDELSNIQHWQMALKHGRVAGLGLSGKPSEIHSVPYFWTMFFGMGLRYAGYGVGFDDVVIHGDLDELQFVAYYTKGDEVVAVASMKSDPVASQYAQFLYGGQTLTKSEIKADPTKWQQRVCGK